MVGQAGLKQKGLTKPKKYNFLSAQSISLMTVSRLITAVISLVGEHIKEKKLDAIPTIFKMKSTPSSI